MNFSFPQPNPFHQRAAGGHRHSMPSVITEGISRVASPSGENAAEREANPSDNYGQAPYSQGVKDLRCEFVIRSRSLATAPANDRIPAGGRFRPIRGRRRSTQDHPCDSNDNERDTFPESIEAHEVSRRTVH